MSEPIEERFPERNLWANDPDLLKYTTDLERKLKIAKEKLQWVSVEDRLPSYSQIVLVWRDCGFHETMMFKSGWWLCTGDGFNDLLNDVHNDITHWMPLPEPPSKPKE